MRRRLDRVIGRRLLDAVLARRPDVVICTHFYPLSVLGDARLRGKLDAPLVGVVTDYTAHAMWAEPGVDLYCTARGGAGADLARHGVPAGNIVATGIPIRPAFAHIERRESTDKLHVLMTSGGFGIGPLEQAIRSFAGLPHLQLTVVCGADDKRVSRASLSAERANVAARIIGFEQDMPARLAEADLVVGKPGGLTVSEALASGRPMGLFGTCPGQEQHNEDWLCLNNAATVLNPLRAGAQIEWLRRCGRLPAMAAAARKLGEPHAARHVIETALACPHQLAA